MLLFSPEAQNECNGHEWQAEETPVSDLNRAASICKIIRPWTIVDIYSQMFGWKLAAIILLATRKAVRQFCLQRNGDCDDDGLNDIETAGDSSFCLLLFSLWTTTSWREGALLNYFGKIKY